MTTLTLLATTLSLAVGTTAETPTASVVTTECAVSANMPLDGRASPLESTTVTLAEGEVTLCYGSPSARGRTMIGGDEVPFGALWRTGANEATVLHTAVPLSVAGIQIEPGSYALYTIPGESEWTLYLSSSTDHWGLQITDEVRALEVGYATLEPEALDDHVESLTFTFEDAGTRSAALVMEWEHTRLEIPVTATGG